METVISEPWKSDGNIIVKVGLKQFRVHKSTLADASPIFRNMFSDGDSSASELQNGCPVVELQGDDPDGIQTIFKILYTPL